MRVLSGLPVKKRVPFGSQEHAVISSVCFTKVLIRVPVYKNEKEEEVNSAVLSQVQLERVPIRMNTFVSQSFTFLSRPHDRSCESSGLQHSCETESSWSMRMWTAIRCFEIIQC